MHRCKKIGSEHRRNQLKMEHSWGEEWHFECYIALKKRTIEEAKDMLENCIVPVFSLYHSFLLKQLK